MQTQAYAFLRFPVLSLAALLLLIGCVPDPPATSAPGEARTAFLGVYVGDSESARGERAAIVFFVLPDGPAERAGVQEGDRILSFAGRPSPSGGELIAALRQQAPDATAPASVERDGQRLELRVRLGGEAPAQTQKRWNAYLAQREQEELQGAADAERAGDRRAAFSAYVRATRAAYYAPAGPDAALTRLAAFVHGLGQPPAAPPEAQRFNERAMATLQSAAGAADNDRAVAEIGSAVVVAPWIADLHLNQGLVLARAGYPDRAATAMRRYLLLAPSAGDAAAIRQKIADLDLLVAEQAAWRPFLTTWSPSNGGKIAIGLRGRTLTVSVAVPRPETDQKPGDTICSGTIEGPRFTGRCALWMTKEKAKACFGARREYEADGGIENGALRLMTTTGLNYGTVSCMINSEQRGAIVWVGNKSSG